MESPLWLHSDVRNLVVMLLRSHSYRLLPHVRFVHCMYKHPLHACSIQEQVLLMATAVLQHHRKGSLQSFSSIMRNGKIISNEISGSEMREFEIEI